MLKSLDQDSGTGLDDLPALILKTCAEELARPISLLVLRILATGIWPESWKTHWIAPLFRRAAAAGYRVGCSRGWQDKGPPLRAH